MLENGQLSLLFAPGAPKEPDDLRLETPERVFPVAMTRNPRARRYVLRLRSNGTVAVTLPARGSRAEAWRFVHSRAAWISRQWSKLRASQVVLTEWPVGTEILLRGAPFRIELETRPQESILRIGPESLRVRDPQADLRRWAEALLRKLAARELPPRVFELAAREGVTVREVTVRNQSSRWGSCSPAGRISLNWRLIQMPEAVRDYIILHELMHRKEMNHSARFWSLVETACPAYRTHEHWIKAHAARLGM